MFLIRYYTISHLRKGGNCGSEIKCACSNTGERGSIWVYTEVLGFAVVVV